MVRALCEAFLLCVHLLLPKVSEGAPRGGVIVGTGLVGLRWHIEGRTVRDTPWGWGLFCLILSSRMGLGD